MPIVDISGVKNWDDLNELLDQCEEPADVDERKSRLRSVIQQMKRSKFKEQYQGDIKEAILTVEESLHGFFE